MLDDVGDVGARDRVAELAEGRSPWAIPWPCLHEFFSIVTHPRIFDPPTPLQAALDQIDAWLAEGLLGGEELNAADFQIAPNVRAMLLSEDLAPFAAERPAGAWALRVVPDYAGHVRAVLPAAWLEPLRREAKPTGSTGRRAAKPYG